MNEQRNADDQSKAEQLDPEVLGDEGGDDGLPGIAGFPPEQPLGVEDPTVLEGGSEAEDDLQIRDWRRSDDGTEEAALHLEEPPESRLATERSNPTPAGAGRLGASAVEARP